MRSLAGARGWLAAAGLIALTALALWGVRRRSDSLPRMASPTGPAVVFVVLDTVRADHTSLCGYDRPTTPTLESLAERGACSCQAVSPGAWTLPSHASYFTGKPVLEHEADFVRVGGIEAEWNPSIAIRPLDARLPTLAERFRTRGYQSVGLSANPVLAVSSGLRRGFERFGECASSSDCTGEQLNQEVRRVLDEGVERERPLFLFVNYMDAHAPWKWVPEGVGWLPPTRSLGLGDLSEAFLAGHLRPEQARRFLQRRTDLYDWGIHRADESLGQLLDDLEERGWLSAGYRLVVTSDHGELLGEHGLLEHGFSLHEENNRVPLCVVDTTRTPAPFESRVSGLVAHDLVLGETPGAYEVSSVAFPRNLRTRSGAAGSELWAAHWEGASKTVLHGEVVELYDLDADGREAAPTTPPPEHEGRRRVEALAHQAARVLAGEGATSEELLDALRALGYVE